MYSVLIVEDEMLVRLGLKSLIKWDRFDMQVIADVQDGKAAMEIYEKEKPDLVITDLKMPVMDGMELIERIRARDEATRIVILSCLDEFNLVRKAMSLGVTDYIPKLTMDENEIEAVLKKIKEELDKTRGSGSAASPDNIDRDLMKEKLLKGYMFYNISTAGELDAGICQLGLRLGQRRMIMCVMELSCFERLKARFNDEKGQLIKLSMLNVLNELLCGSRRGEAFYDDDTHYILLFSFEDIISEQSMFQELHNILNNVRDKLYTFFNSSVSFGSSGIHDGYGALTGMYREASEALKNKFFFGPGLYESSISLEKEKKCLEKTESLLSMPKLKKFMDGENYREYVEKINMLKTVSDLDKEQVQDFFIRLLQWTSSAINLKSSVSNDAILKYIQEIRGCETLDDIILCYERFTSEITKSSIENRVTSREVSKAMTFIKRNFEKDISLQQVAEHVNLSPAYLSNLFKKELQVNFVDYLNELRVDKAKELLLGTYLKSYEVAERVGFSEETYFSKVFKKLTGLSPKEFRKPWLRDNMGESGSVDN